MPVCKNRFEKSARIFSRRHKQTTYSDAVFLGALRVKWDLFSSVPEEALCWQGNTCKNKTILYYFSQEKNPEPAKPSTEQLEQSKPKKNKRKPDFVQRKPLPVLTQNSSEREIPKSRSSSPSRSFSEDSGCYDISKEELKSTPNGTSPDKNVLYTEMTCLDLSVVKKEKEDDYVDHLEAGGKKIKLETGE